MSEQSTILYFFILLIAMLYSSVGHGGASGYLALMSFTSMPLINIKPVALILNIVVSLIAFIQFYRKGYFESKLFIYLAIASIPAAYLGGSIHINASIYKQIVGIALLLSAIRLFWPINNKIVDIKQYQAITLLIIGALIGFISGLIGIGGGIILSPLLIFLAYTDAKTTAGISALFIFVNSIAGLLGQMRLGISVSSSMQFMIGVSIIGAIIGAYIGAQKFNITVIKKVLALVLIVAACKLILV